MRWVREILRRVLLCESMRRVCTWESKNKDQFLHVRMLWPGLPHLLQILCFLIGCVVLLTTVAGSCVSGTSSTSGVLREDDVGRGTVGRGQVRSRHCSGQNSRILSKRYHCLSFVKPHGCIIGGRALGTTVWLSVRRCLSFLTGSWLVVFKRISPKNGSQKWNHDKSLKT